MGKRKAEEEKEMMAPLWVVTWGDLISLLLTFFILLYTFSATDQDEAAKVYGSLRGAMGVVTPPGSKSAPNVKETETNQQDVSHLDGSTVRPERPPDEEEQFVNKVQSKDFDVPVAFDSVADGLRIKISSDDLFLPGSLLIRKKAREIALEIGRYFRDLPCRIVVEAYTDDRTWESTRFAGPTDLTRAMALNVAQVVVNETSWPVTRVGIAGFGAARPVGSNETSLGRRANRRIEVLVIRDEGRN